MQELEKILEEIDKATDEYGMVDYVNGEPVISKNQAKDIIRKHMNDGWIPVERELPQNAKYKGALCPMYQLDTKYGVTEGWYNPDLESWYVLCWFIGVDYLETEIDFEKGTYPKVVRCENLVNDKHSIVLAWRPLPEPYRPEQPETCKYTGGSCCWPIDQCRDCPNHPERSDNHDGEE